MAWHGSPTAITFMDCFSITPSITRSASCASSYRANSPGMIGSLSAQIFRKCVGVNRNSPFSFWRSAHTRSASGNTACRTAAFCASASRPGTVGTCHLPSSGSADWQKRSTVSIASRAVCAGCNTLSSNVSG